MIGDEVNWLSQTLFHGSTQPWLNHAIGIIKTDSPWERRQLGTGLYVAGEAHIARVYASGVLNRGTTADPHMYHLRSKISEPNIIDMDKPLTPSVATIFARSIDPEAVKKQLAGAEFEGLDNPGTYSSEESGIDAFRKGYFRYSDTLLNKNLRAAGYHGMAWSERVEGFMDPSGKMHTYPDYAPRIYKFFDPNDLQLTKYEKGLGTEPVSAALISEAKRAMWVKYEAAAKARKAMAKRSSARTGLRGSTLTSSKYYRDVLQSAKNLFGR